MDLEIPDGFQAVHVRVATGEWSRTEARAVSRQMRDTLLGKLIGDEFTTDRIVRDAYGRPSYPTIPHLCWSSSSAEGAAGIAWSGACKVGLDLEATDSQPATDTLLSDVLTAQELVARSERSPGEPFGSIWTRKEAVLKCIGMGLHVRPNEFDVGWRDPNWKQAVHLGRACCWIRSLDIGPNLYCALACEHISETDFQFLRHS